MTPSERFPAQFPEHQELIDRLWESLLGGHSNPACPVVVVMRGLPGSGKSTVAQTLLLQWFAKHVPAFDDETIQRLAKEHISSADQFRTIDGQYVYGDPMRPNALSQCWLDFVAKLSAVPRLLEYGPPFDRFVVSRSFNEIRSSFMIRVIDNTNTRADRIEPYATHAQALGYAVRVLRIDATLRDCLLRQTHGVPEERMREMYQDLQLPLTRRIVEVS